MTGEERGTGHTYVELQHQVLGYSVHLLVVTHQRVWRRARAAFQMLLRMKSNK